MTPTYAKLLADGRYEYGFIEVNRANRRKDKEAPVGVAVNYEAARAAMATLELGA